MTEKPKIVAARFDVTTWCMHLTWSDGYRSEDSYLNVVGLGVDHSKLRVEVCADGRTILFPDLPGSIVVDRC